jgi:CelD/BcsL family acetyltransferase involved in cellulose biosynthesis
MRVVVAEGQPHTECAWPSLRDAPEGAHVFQTRDYLETWAATIGAARGARLFFATASDVQGPLFHLPLVIERRRGVRVLTFPDGGVADYNAPIVTPAGAALGVAAAREAWRLILQRLPPVDFVSLAKMPDSIAERANPLRHVASALDETAGHVVRLNGDWPHFAATRLHRSKDSRRKRRRLSELGDTRLVVARTTEDAAPLLAAMVAQKSRRYVARRGADGFDRPGYRTYFSAMTERFLPHGAVHLSALMVGNAIAAAHWGLVMGGRFYCLMLSFDEQGPWAKYSPGRLLVEDMIAWCYQNGISAFDLGFGEAAWKDLLCDQIVPMFRLEQARTVAGLAYLGAANVYRAARDVRMPRDRGTRPLPSAP